jgi:hypothetical protein
MKIYEINSKKYGKVEVLLDDEDYDRVIKENIILHPKYDKTINNFYIQFHIKDNNKKDKRTTIGLHRWLLNCPKGLQVDHINHNTLDNRRCNLKICTQLENANNKSFYRNNKSGIKGVYFIKLFNCWIAELKHNKVCYRSKRCKTKEEAMVERRILEERILKGGDVNVL